MTTFNDLNLGEPILKALAQEGYTAPTPIQAQAIPHLLGGADLLGIAQTGTGKTAAFALPILERLAREGKHAAPGTCRALILSPTRELAAQIGESFKVYGRNMRLKSAVAYGGVGIGKQIETARRGIDILVATPGRLCDLLDRRALNLSKVEIFVLDEVDQMLDLGFIHAIRRIVSLLPGQRQSLFFSATMPKEIASLASGLLKDPVRIQITPVATTAERVRQSVIHVDPGRKAQLLCELLKDNAMTRTLVFTRTKHGADKVVKALDRAGYEAAAIHGNKSQNNRERALQGFKSGQILALVATDIAARGIDVDGVSHVINFDLPHVPESYVHRIGRTARAGADGEAIAFCSREERGLLRDIERTIRSAIAVKEHELAMSAADVSAPWSPVEVKENSGGGRNGGRGARKPHRGQQPRGFNDRGAGAGDGRGGRGQRPERAGARADATEVRGEGREREGFAGGGGRGSSRPRRDGEDRNRQDREHHRGQAPRHGHGGGERAAAQDGRRPEGRSHEGRRTEGRPHEGRRHEGRPYEGRSHEGRAPDARAKDMRGNDHRGPGVRGGASNNQDRPNQDRPRHERPKHEHSKHEHTNHERAQSARGSDAPRSDARGSEGRGNAAKPQSRPPQGKRGGDGFLKRKPGSSDSWMRKLSGNA